jgi:hypothetical protein
MERRRKRMKKAMADLTRDGIDPSRFEFSPGALLGFICVDLCSSVDGFGFKWNDSL